MLKIYLLSFIPSALLNKPNALSPGNFKLVMERNLPVSDNVQLLFLNKLQTLPAGIAKQLRDLQMDNTVYTTLATVQRQINALTILYNDVLISSVNQCIAGGSKETAIQILETLNTPEANQALVSTYLADGDLAAATTKLAQIPVDNPTMADWVDLTNIQIDIATNNKTIFDLSASQQQAVQIIANKCPASLATANAQAILSLLYNEEFDMCEDNSVAKFNYNDFIPGTTDTSDTNEDWYLGNNIPNPFTGATNIPYYLPIGASGKIIVTDINGIIKETFILEEGYNEIEIYSKDWSSGVYFYGLKINGALLKHKKMTILK